MIVVVPVDKLHEEIGRLARTYGAVLLYYAYLSHTPLLAWMEGGHIRARVLPRGEEDYYVEKLGLNVRRFRVEKRGYEALIKPED